MKIKTITCHDVYNHGASLQSYALMKYLQCLGHEVEIIDYKPDYLSNHYNFFSVGNAKFSKNIFIKSLYLIAKIPERIFSLRRKSSFDRFKIKYLTLTTSRYNNNEELRNNPPIADTYICGSDQIWNTLHENGKDPAFYLDFAPTKSKRIAYAASLATDKIYNGHDEFIIKKVSNLDQVGVRESSGVSILNELGVRGVKHVMDPAFLLDSQQWNTVASGEFSDNYLLVYDFDNSEEIKNKALEISKKEGWKIYSVNPGKFEYADKRFDNVGPDVFLSLIRDAKLVISNSFHAVVFPLIYKVPFIVVNRGEAINERMADMLKTIGKFNAIELGEVVSYDNTIDTLLRGKIDESKKYLDKALGDYD